MSPARALLAVVALLALVAAGCGNKHSVTTEGETEGIWVDVGGLDYHVQGSRQLNPAQVPDDAYLAGVPEDVEPPAADETWFVVFLRIENKTDAPEPTAEHFEIEDTEGDVYEPVEFEPEANPFAYHPIELGVKETIPHPDSAQELDSAAGAMLLFKLPLEGYANRPLELVIEAPEGAGEGPERAHLALDV